MLEVSLLTLGSPSQLTGGYLYHQRLAEAAGSHDARLRFVSLPDRPFPLPALWCRQALRKAQPTDIVVVDSIVAAFVAPAVAVAPPLVPLVAVAHQAPGGIDHGPLRRHVQAPLDRLLYRRVERVLAASDALASELVAGGLDASRVEVVPPGCDVGVPEGSPPDLRRGRHSAFIAVGNWVERKGILELLDAFGRLPADAATLHLVGRDDVDARYAARVRSRLKAEDLAGRVVVHGPVSRERVATLLAASDAFVLPSTREPYGTVYGEALAMGLPVVGWRAGNLPHLAQDGKEGIVLAPGDIAGLTAALLRLSTDDAHREQLRRGAAARGRSLPTWEQTADRFFEIMRDVVARRQQGTAG